MSGIMNDVLLERILDDMAMQEVIDTAFEDDPYELPDHPTWAQILEREPRVGDLVMVAREGYVSDPETYDFWYRTVKPRIENLVGKFAMQPWPLRDSSVYDVVYRALLHVYKTGELPA